MRLWLMGLVLIASVTGCGGSATPSGSSPSSSKPEGKVVIKPGGIYSCKSGDGDFSVVKVLVFEDGAVHARLHKNRYQVRPTTIDPKELKVAIGHVPLSEEGFRNWEPKLLLEQPVREEELVGYRLWNER